MPWITRTSSSASAHAAASCEVRCGVTDAIATTPAARISWMRWVTSSGWTGSRYICCIRGVALSSSSSRISSNSGVGVLVAGPQPLEVEHTGAAETAELDRRRGAHDPVHRRAEERQLEAERVELPGDVDVLGVARPPARDDRDVVEAVGLPTRLVDPDLDLCHGALRFAVRSPARPRRSPNLPARCVATSAVSAAAPTTRLHSSVRMRAVAPQTVSPATSKKKIGNVPSPSRSRGVGRRHRSSSEDAVGDAARRSRRRSTRSTSSGWATKRGTARQDADEGADDRSRGERHDRAEPADRRRRRRVRGPPLRGPREARRRAVPRRARAARRGRPPRRGAGAACRRAV